MKTYRLIAALAVAGLPFVAATSRAQGVPNRLTLTEAKRIIERAHKAAADTNLRLSIAVVDARGDLIAFGRMPGAPAGTADTAIGKAMLSAIYGQPSAALVGRATNPATQGLNEASGGRLRFLQGAVPIIRGGYVVGAVAGSGATAQQDEQMATAGLAGLE
jgi:uncharacterized protein GlcG (DUF336 family)